MISVVVAVLVPFSRIATVQLPVNFIAHHVQTGSTIWRQKGHLSVCTLALLRSRCCRFFAMERCVGERDMVNKSKQLIDRENKMRC